MKLLGTFVLALSLGLIGTASAQVGASITQWGALPALSQFKRTGNTLQAPDGSRIALTVQRGMVTAAQVTLPSGDAVRAGQLLGALTGYGDGLGQAYTAYLQDPKNQPALLKGNSLNAQQFVVDNKLTPPSSGNTNPRLTFTVTLPEVPSSAFERTKNAIGTVSAPVVLRLYSDFQCPYCEQFETQTWPGLQKTLGKQLGTTVRYEFHQFPLEQIHPNARPAAEASECAAQQSKFWEFHDALFEPPQWQQWVKSANPNLDFISYASDLKLNVAAFKNCLAERGGKAAVDAGLVNGQQVGVNGTPTLFVNGFKVPNPHDISAIMQMINTVKGK